MLTLKPDWNALFRNRPVVWNSMGKKVANILSNYLNNFVELMS
jgi:hypothetical protein